MEETTWEQVQKAWAAAGRKLSEWGVVSPRLMLAGGGLFLTLSNWGLLPSVCIFTLNHPPLFPSVCFPTNLCINHSDGAGKRAAIRIYHDHLLSGNLIITCAFDQESEPHACHESPAEVYQGEGLET